MALDNLEIIIDVVDSFSEEIDRLIADLETADFVSEQVDNIRINLDVVGERELSRAVGELETVDTIGDQRIDIDVNVSDHQLDRLRSTLHSLEAETVDEITQRVDVRGTHNIESAIAEIETLQRIADRGVTVDVDVSDHNLGRLLSELETIQAIGDQRIDVDVADHQLDQLRAKLESLDLQTADDVTQDVDVDGQSEIAEALSSIALLEITAEDDIRIDIDVTGDAEIVRAIGELTALKSLSEAIDDETIGIDMDSESFSEMLSNMGRVGGPARGDGPQEGFFNFTMADLHNALAKLIPLIFVYIGALPALIGAIGGLAAAAIAATAALAGLTAFATGGLALQMGDGDMMAGMEEIGERVQQDFMDAFEPLMQDLAPLADDALDGLEQLFDELAANGDILKNLTDDARAFGGFMQEYVVGTITEMGQLAEASAPLFGVLGQVLADLDLMRGFAGFLAATLPQLMAFGSALADILVTLSKMSVGFLSVATRMTQMLNIMFEVLTLGGLLDEQFGAFIGTLLALTTIISILNSQALAGFLRTLWSVTGALLGYTEASSVAITSSLSLGTAINFITNNLRRLAVTAAVVTGGLYALVAFAGTVLSTFIGVEQEISNATDSLKEFKNMQDSLDSGMGGGGSMVYEFNPTERNTVINTNNVEEGKRMMKTNDFRKNMSDYQTLSGG